VIAAAVDVPVKILIMTIKQSNKSEPQSTPTPPGIVDADKEQVIKNTIWALVHAWQMSDGDDTKDRWVAVEKYVLSICKPVNIPMSGIVDKLKEQNPYRYNKEEVEKWRAYTKCCDTLAALLSVDGKEKKEEE
jgi:hypothetical protein